MIDRIGVLFLIFSSCIIFYTDMALSNDQYEYLHVDIIPVQESYKAIDQVLIEFTLRNNSTTPVSVLKWNTPLENDIEFNADMFDVALEGSRVRYIGRKVKRVPPQESDYLTIAPGKSVSAILDLSKGYALDAPGIYSVRYRKESIKTLKAAGRIEFSVQQKTSPIQIKIVEQRSSKQTGLFKQPPAFIGCSASQQETLNNALDQAESMALIARNSLSNAPVSMRPDATRYTTWFGSYDPERYAHINEHFSAIYNVVNGQTVSFDCSECTEDNAYAYVLPDQPYTVYLCPVFWIAPITGTDSQAGTIVHETSHFTVVAGTDDNAYGQDDSKSLAISSPELAISNADSHEYFAENNPPLYMPIESVALPAIYKLLLKH
jgi:peptidyl-Lys metalloendopeptidase